MRYYISDLHFYHENIINIDGRTFSDALEMNNYMIEKWNSKVRDNDEVFVLGDLSLGSGEETNCILDRLNGIKYLIVGNHDKYLNDKSFNRTNFKWIKSYYELRDGDYRVVLSHYPIFCYNGQQYVDEYGNSNTYMLYGHVHNSPDEKLIDRFIKDTKQIVRTNPSGITYNMPCNMINCFCQFSDFEPLSLVEWIKADFERRMNTVDNNWEELWKK